MCGNIIVLKDFHNSIQYNVNTKLGWQTKNLQIKIKLKGTIIAKLQDTFLQKGKFREDSTITVSLSDLNLQ
jgi:hypothetical protein